MPTIRDVAAFLEDWAPPATAQSYDNVGLQIGDPARTVTRGVIALDLTREVVDEARTTGAELIITHHPLIFRPIRRVTADDSHAGLVYRLAEAGIALYSIHTNLDAAPGGVSFGLADQLGLINARFLDGHAGILQKLAVFVPRDFLDKVREALASAGAGQIGDYDACAFSLPGTGYFRPGANASPFIGSSGGALERVEEVRLEVEVPRWKLDTVLAAAREAHPYEEVAYDVYDVHQPYSRAGLGAIGSLPQREDLGSFLTRITQRLGVSSLRFTGDLDMPIERVAVCGGSGSDFIGAARRAGADAYVTSDITYHKFFDVLDGTGRCRMALIDAGHYETEAVTEKLVHAYLNEHLPEVEWLITSHATNPVNYFQGDAVRVSSHEIKDSAS